MLVLDYMHHTTYENNQPLPAQPTVTDPDELEHYEQKYLTSKKAYAFETTNLDKDNPNIELPTNLITTVLEILLEYVEIAIYLLIYLPNTLSTIVTIAKKL